MLAIVVLSVLTVGWLGLAMMPAFAELRNPQDDAPLDVDTYEGDVRSFATGFRRYMAEQLPNLRLVRRLGGGQEGTLPDGTPLLKLLDRASPLTMHAQGLDEVEMTDRVTHKLVVSYAQMILPRGLASTGGLYATDFVCGGEAGVFRALLGERDVVLGRRSTVLRWVHSDANLTVEDDSTLYGRASAERGLYIGGGTKFERLYGRPILFGDLFTPMGGKDKPERELTPFEILKAVDTGGNRVVVAGDLTIPPFSTIATNLVVRGSLRIGQHSQVTGCVKCHGTLTVEPYARVIGSIVSSGDIVLEEGAMVDAPVIAEGDADVAAGVLIGQYSKLATLTADRVTVSPGAAVFGTIWTRKGGVVRAAAASPAIGAPMVSAEPSRSPD